MPGPTGKVAPRFACRISKQTGDGEMVEVSFTADDQGELAKRLQQATAALETRMEANNQKVLRLQATLRDEATRLLAAQAAAAGGNGGTADADASAGAAHPTADS